MMVYVHSEVVEQGVEIEDHLGMRHQVTPDDVKRFVARALAAATSR